MNVVVLVGRLTANPETRHDTEGNGVCRYTLAVDRRYKKEGGQTADFIRCVAFGRNADFTDKYFKQGMRVSVQGHIQTGSYKNKDGITVYTTDVIVDSQEFAQSKTEGGDTLTTAKRPERDEPQKADDGFVQVPEGIEEELPFN